MSGYIRRGVNLFSATGGRVGYIDGNGNEVLDPVAAAGVGYVLMGDSRFNDCTVQVNDSSYHTNISPVEYANAKSGGRMVLVKNSGIAGNTTDQMVARMQTDLVNVPAAVALIHGGTNDPIAAGQEYLTFNNLRTLWEASMASGKWTIGFTEYAGSSDGAGKPAQKIRLNNLIREWWAGRAGGELIDLFALLSDPLANPPTVKANITRDGLHMAPFGAQTWGDGLVPSFTRLTGQPLALVNSVMDCIGNEPLSTNLCDNSLMQGTSGTISGAGNSGTLPTGWSGTGAVGTNVFSVVARADGIGNDLRIATTMGGSGNLNTFYSLTLARILAGTYVVEGELTCESTAGGLNTLQVNANIQVDGVTKLIGCFLQATATGVLAVPTAQVYRFRSIPLVIPPFANCTFGQLRFQQQYNAAGGSVARLGRVAFRRIG